VTYSGAVEGYTMIALLLLASLPALAEVGVAPSTVKVLPEIPVPAAQAIRLQAALGEWEGFQVAVRDAAGLTGVDLVVSDLAGPGGATLSSAQAHRYREVFLDIEEPSGVSMTLHEREPGLYPDPLVPFVDPYSGEALAAPFDLAPDETGAIYVDIEIPRAATPGTYRGSATLTADGIDPVNLSITLEVWAFALPETRTVATSYGFSWNQVERFHGGPEGTTDVTPIIDRYYLALHEHRIDPTNVNGPVTFTFDDGGTLEPVDWTDYDAAVGPWLDGSRFPDGEGVTRFNVGRFRPGGGTGSMSDHEWGQAAAAFAEHLEEKGWWEHGYVYATDEPWLNGGIDTYTQIHEDAQRLFSYSELWRGHILVTSPYQEIIDGDVGIWCPVTPMFGDWFYYEGWYEGREFYAARTDEELWFYVCNANFPPSAGYDIDTPIGHEPRIVKWGAWFEGASGFLYWRTNYWVENDPWNVWRNVDQFGNMFARNGDGFLLYPGDHDGTAGGKGSPEWVAIDGPIVSYRLKQVRDGLEDWELFALASDLGGETYARAQVGRAYDRFGDFFLENCDIEACYCPEDQPWTLDPELLEEVRGNIAAKVLFLLDPDTWPDPENPPDEVDGDGCGGCGGGHGAGPVGLLVLIGLIRRRSGRR
jgi:hypothetical protein